MVALLPVRLFLQTRLTGSRWWTFSGVSFALWIRSIALNVIKRMGSVQFNLRGCVSLWVCGSQTGEWRHGPGQREVVEESNQSSVDVVTFREELEGSCFVQLLAAATWQYWVAHCRWRVSIEGNNFLWLPPISGSVPINECKMKDTQNTTVKSLLVVLSMYW